MDNLQEQKAKLAEFKTFLKSDKELFKGYFGLLFWQLQQAGDGLTIDAVTEQQSSLTMIDPDDEALGTMLGIFLNVWDSSKDYNASCRFMVSTLEMTADELLQAKILYEKN